MRRGTERDSYVKDADKMLQRSSTGAKTTTTIFKCILYEVNIAIASNYERGLLKAKY